MSLWSNICLVIVTLYFSKHTIAKYVCHCKDNCPENPEDVPDHTCNGNCEIGWSGPYCQRQNVAFEKNATQVSTYSEKLSRFGKLWRKKLSNTPDKAVDGNTNVFYSRGSCTHTGLYETAPYWNVDLGGRYQIYSMTIYSRSNMRKRFKGFQVLVDGVVCYKWSSNEIPFSKVQLHCGSSLYGRHVMVRLPEKSNKQFQYLSLCEVLIFVCSDYWFGDMCAERCNCRDSDEVCDKVSGSCQSGCPDGVSGSSCRPGGSCPVGTWGMTCESRCGYCLNGFTCNRLNGSCGLLGCKTGWTGDRCDVENAGSGNGIVFDTSTFFDESSNTTRNLQLLSDTPGNYLRSGEIASIVLAVILAVLIAAIVVFFVMRLGKKRKDSIYDGVLPVNDSEHEYDEIKHDANRVTETKGVLDHWYESVKDTGRLNRIKVPPSKSETVKNDLYDGYLEPLPFKPDDKKPSQQQTLEAEQQSC